MLFQPRSSLVIVFLLFFPISELHAVTVDDLYVAEVLVTSEDSRQLRAGARSGLMQVLLRVSGDPEVGSSSLITGAMRNVESYYYQFSYESTDKALMVDGEEVPALALRLHFEPSAVARLLRSGGFQVWGSNRPGVMLWLAVNEGNGRRIVGSSEDSELMSRLQEQSELRGLPLLFPLLDIEDTANIGTAEVWGAFLGRIQDASERYNPDVILTARIQRDSLGRWLANWSWFSEARWQAEQTEADTLDELVAAKVGALTGELAARYAIDSSRGQVVMRVEAVDSLQAYAEVSRYVESLGPVVDSSVTRIAEGEVEFRLNTEGQDAQLVRVIELDEKMVLLNPDTTTQALHYRWLAR